MEKPKAETEVNQETVSDMLVSSRCVIIHDCLDSLLYKLYKSRFDSTIRGKKFFSQRIIDNWNNLCSGVIERNSSYAIQKPIRYFHSRSRDYKIVCTLSSLCSCLTYAASR